MSTTPSAQEALATHLKAVKTAEELVNTAKSALDAKGGKDNKDEQVAFDNANSNLKILTGQTVAIQDKAAAEAKAAAVAVSRTFVSSST